MGYPSDFSWGVASASYQVEGAAKEDGKGPSIWDMFTRKPGAIWLDQNGDVACDHYHLYPQDVELMHDLGIKAYRFSVSWPRVIPDGYGMVNRKGLEFYDRLVDKLMDSNIEPWITLFHWDYPLALYYRGGWLNSDSPAWFEDYASTVVERLSDRVSHWITFNEPQCFILNGMYRGITAPGDKLRIDEVLRAAHHVLLAHGRAVKAIRAKAKLPPSIGFAPQGWVKMPATTASEDIAAARQEMFTTTRDLFTNTWWMDPVFLGRYPEDGLKLFDGHLPEITQEDLKIISQPIDFIGANIYFGSFVRAGKDGKAEVLPLPSGYPKTSQVDMPITPECLYWGPKFFHERYGLPVVITENGHQNADIISRDGKVHDPQRIDYLHRHLLELRKAIDDGVPVSGYFQWCFTDNFEWQLGDAIKVGIVYTDYPTQRRIPKDSAYWYGDVIRSNGTTL